MNKPGEMQNRMERKVPPSFRISDAEVYMIRENNIKRIHDILKNSYTAKPNEECNIILDEDLETNNKNLVDSMAKMRELFDKVYNVSETKKYFKEKLENKYQECQEHIVESNKTEELQKSINSTMNYIRRNSKLN